MSKRKFQTVQVSEKEMTSIMHYSVAKNIWHGVLVDRIKNSTNKTLKCSDPKIYKTVKGYLIKLRKKS